MTGVSFMVLAASKKPAVTTLIDVIGGGFTLIGNMNTSIALSAIFDGTASQSTAQVGYASAPAAGYNAFAGVDWGSGNTKTITRFTAYSCNDIPGFANSGARNMKLQGSTDNFSSSIVDLTSPIAGPATIGSNVDVTSGSITTTTAYRYHRLAIDCPGAANVRMAELSLYEDI